MGGHIRGGARSGRTLKGWGKEWEDTEGVGQASHLHYF